MRDAAPKTIHLKDYTPFGFEIEKVDLTFRLSPHATRVVSKIHFVPDLSVPERTFFLHGEQLLLIQASIDGAQVTPGSMPMIGMIVAPSANAACMAS